MQTVKNTQKSIIVIAGPNGSGKTTFSKSFFQNNESLFLNPHLIVAGFSTRGSEQAALMAGRILLQEIRSKIQNNVTFGFETTLSGRTYFSLLQEAKKAGYRIEIYFIYLSDVNLSLKRIKKRVSLGGHDIPLETVLRRYSKVFINFWTLYRPLCDNWFVFDNSKKFPNLRLSKETFETFSLDQQNKLANEFTKR